MRKASLFVCSACANIDDDTDEETGLCSKCLKIVEGEHEKEEEEEY